MQRLTKLDPGTLAGRKREVYNTIAGGPRGGVRGPFVALLQCPDIADYVQGLGAHLRFEGALPGPLRELAILMTARFWTAAYEWCAHVTIAEKEGLAPEVITAIGDKKMPEFQSAEEKAVYDFCREALEQRRVGDDAFAVVVDALGRAGAAELAAVMGYYSLISMVLNTFKIVPPEGAEPPF